MNKTTFDEIYKQLSSIDSQYYIEISSFLAMIQYRPELTKYLKSRGGLVASVSDEVCNLAVKHGAVVDLAELALSSKYKYTEVLPLNEEVDISNILGEKGRNFLLHLTNQTPSLGRINSGKGELLLAILLGNVKGASTGGDLEVEEIGLVEVKGKASVPGGQKLQIAGGSYEAIQKVCEYYLDICSAPRPKKLRVYKLIPLVYEALTNYDLTLRDNFIQQLDNILHKWYGQLFTQVNVDFTVKTYCNEKYFEINSFEQDFCTLFVHKYLQDEHFNEVLFLEVKNTSIKAVRVLSQQLEDYIKSGKIHIWMRDEKPRWTYLFKDTI